MKPKTLVNLPANVGTSTDSIHSCPHCGFEHEELSGDCIPKAGDISICSRCFSYGIVAADLTVRVPTLTEQLTLDRDVGLQAMRALVKAAWTFGDRTRGSKWTLGDRKRGSKT
jgi:hypothetical protein